MHDDNADNDEWQKIVEREETVQSSIIRRKTTKKQFLNRLADERNGFKQAGNHLGTPEAHLSPGKHVTEKAGCHCQQIDDNTEQPQHFTRRLVRAVIQPASDVHI